MILEKTIDPNEGLFHALALISTVGIFQTDVNGDCVYVNSRWCEIAGLSPEQAYGKGWVSALHPEDRERVCEQWERAVHANDWFRASYRFLRPDGTTTWVRGEAMGYLNPTGQLAGYIGTVTDITELKDSERELLRAKEQYQLLFYANPLPGWVFDIETLAFLEVNQTAVQHYGYSREEFLSMTLRDLRSAEEFPKLEESLKQLPVGLKRAGVWKHKKKDGTFVEAEVFNYGITFGGRPARLVLCHDVTERKYHEETLKETGRLAALAETSAIFAHEIANPLNGISTVLQILLRATAPNDTRQRELLQDASNEINRLSLLLQEFRTFARPEHVQREPFNVKELVRELLSTETADYAARGIEIEQELGGNDPVLVADRQKLKQVLLNLFRNAVEAMPEGGKLKIRVSETRGGLQIEVGDTGVGLPRDINIFDAFTTTKAGGTGLGLAIVKKIVAAHGGKIAYTSSPGEGTTFTLVFPRQPVNAAGPSLA